MYDAEREMLVAIMDKAMMRSVECERGIIAVSMDGRGLALVGPDCVIYAHMIHPELPPFDLCLN